MTTPRTQTASKVAKTLGIHVKTVRSWFAAGAPHRREGKGGFLASAEEIAAWLRSTGRSTKPGRPDLKEERLRKQPTGFPRMALALDNAALTAAMGKLGTLLDEETPAQARELADTWALAVEAVMVQTVYGGGTCPAMPQSHWRSVLATWTPAQWNRAASFAFWALCRVLDKHFGKRGAWLAKLEPSARKEVSAWLKRAEQE